MRLKLISAFLLAIVAVTAHAERPVSAITRNKPRLVVNIVVSQMRYDYLLRYADNFSDDGFHTLVRQGSLCTRAMYGHALTRSAVGLATLTTGTNPSTHGVIGNRWLNLTTGETVELARDAREFTTGSDEYDGQYSPRTLIASTIGDQLKSTHRDSKVISIALDPVSAVVMGGHNPDGVYWINPRNGRWVTSSYYSKLLPQWVLKFNENDHVSSYSSERWNISKPLYRYRNVEYSEIALDTLKGISFDYLTRKKYDYDRLATTPGGNTMVKDFAVQAVIYEGLGKDDEPDILNVVFDATRLIGQKYGTGSLEIEDAYYRLDADIASLLSFLETQVGKEHLLVVLTSDHGGSDPVRLDGRTPAGVFNTNQFAAIVSGFLGAQLGTNDWLLKVENRQVYLNRPLLYQKGHNLEDIQNRVANFVIQFSGVSHAVTATALQNGHYTDGVLGRIQNSFYPRSSGDVIVNLMPGWIDYAEDKISDSGSPYNYDIHVPLIWYGGSVSGQHVRRDVDMTDVAPTIADILGIAPPQASTGTPIQEVLRR